MPVQNTSSVYGSVAKAFHWVIAILIICLLIMGFVMSDMEPTPDKFRLYGLHKSIGITVLTLAVLRLLWRMGNIVPTLPDHMKMLERFLAHGSHVALYLVMVLMPLSGWVMSSAAGLPVSIFGWVTLPNLVAPDQGVKALMIDVHYFMALVIIGLVSLHALAALLHHFYYKDNVLVRMLPFGKER